MTACMCSLSTCSSPLLVQYAGCKTWCADRFGQYALHDLVILDPQTAGVIISISATSCRVLTNQVLPACGA